MTSTERLKAIYTQLEQGTSPSAYVGFETSQERLELLDLLRELVLVRAQTARRQQLMVDGKIPHLDIPRAQLAEALRFLRLLMKTELADALQVHHGECRLCGDYVWDDPDEHRCTPSSPEPQQCLKVASAS